MTQLTPLWTLLTCVMAAGIGIPNAAAQEPPRGRGVGVGRFSDLGPARSAIPMEVNVAFADRVVLGTVLEFLPVRKVQVPCGAWRRLGPPAGKGSGCASRR